MNLAELANELLQQLRGLQDQSQLASRIERIEITEGLDSTGDPALYIWVLLANDVPAKLITLKTVRPLEQAVVRHIFQRGDTRWPYVHFQRVSEYEEMLQLGGGLD